MSFSFIIKKNIGELMYGNMLIHKWNLSYKPFDDDLFSLYDFELFISRIKNDKDCSYYKDRKLLFDYMNHQFIIRPNNIIIPINETNKKELIDILQKMYDWTQSVIINKTLIENDL